MTQVGSGLSRSLEPSFPLVPKNDPALRMSTFFTQGRVLSVTSGESPIARKPPSSFRSKPMRIRESLAMNA